MGLFYFSCRRVLLHSKSVWRIGTNGFMNSAKTTWVSTEPNRRIGLKLSFGNSDSCEQCLKYLTTDVNVTVLSSDVKGSKELVILPHQSPVETVQEVLTDLKKNENGNYTILKHVRRGVKTIVEFGSPNIAKPLHMGHLRSAVTGHYVARIHKALDHDVHSFCFLGDWGTQFGLLQAGLSQAHPEEPLDKIVQALNVSTLLEYYVDATKKEKDNPAFAALARQQSAALELGDKSAYSVWSKVREKSVEHLNSVWKELGINYDVMQGESDYTMTSDHTKRAMNLLKDSGVLQTSADGTKFALVNLPRSSSPARATLVKSDGSSLYILRDIAAAIHRKFDYGFDRMIYVVDSSQSNHFIALFDILHQMKILSSDEPQDGPALLHVPFGRVEGQSTRSGTFTLLMDVIRDGTDMMDVIRATSPNTRYKEDKSISKELAISALVISSLKVRRNKNVKFDWEQALKSSGDTGVSLQYCHARLLSLLMKQSEEFFNSNQELKYQVDYEYILTDPIALDLVLQMANFEDALWSSFNELEPCILVNYLFRLRDKTSKALKLLKVKGEEEKDIAASRLFIFMLAKNIMSYGMSVLGIRPLEQM